MKLYKDNLTAGLYEMTPEEILAQFKTSEFDTEEMQDWRPLEYRLGLFIGEKEPKGLNSTFEHSEFQKVKWYQLYKKAQATIPASAQ